MPRKRLWFERPAVHLTAAAQSHAAAAGFDAPTPGEAAQEPEREPSAHERTARRQRRTDTGRFTA